MGNARLSRELSEVLATGAGANARNSRELAEVLAAGANANARLSTELAEVLGAGAGANARLTTELLEVLIASGPHGGVVCGGTALIGVIASRTASGGGVVGGAGVDTLEEGGEDESEEYFEIGSEGIKVGGASALVSSTHANITVVSGGSCECCGDNLCPICDGLPEVLYYTMSATSAFFPCLSFMVDNPVEMTYDPVAGGWPINTFNGTCGIIGTWVCAGTGTSGGLYFLGSIITGDSGVPGIVFGGGYSNQLVVELDCDPTYIQEHWLYTPAPFVGFITP